VFLEKHWKSVIHRSICDYFFEAQSKVGYHFCCLSTCICSPIRLQVSVTCWVTDYLLLISVHIIAQSANRYIVAFHIAIGSVGIDLCCDGCQFVYMAASGPAVDSYQHCLSLPFSPTNAILSTSEYN